MHRVAAMEDEAKDEEATAKLQAAINQVRLAPFVFREAVSTRSLVVSPIGGWTSPVRAGCEIRGTTFMPRTIKLVYWCRCCVVGLCPCPDKLMGRDICTFPGALAMHTLTIILFVTVCWLRLLVMCIKHLIIFDQIQ